MHNFNITQTYFGKDDPWLGILAAASYEICSTKNRLKCYSPGQLVFGRDMILLITHTVDWELIPQQNQTQINKDNIHKILNELTTTIKSEIKSCSIITLHTNMKHHIRAPFVITRCWTNGAVTIHCGATKIRHNIRRIKPYKYYKTLKILPLKNMYDDVNI